MICSKYVLIFARRVAGIWEECTDHCNSVGSAQQSSKEFSIQYQDGPRESAAICPSSSITSVLINGRQPFEEHWDKEAVQRGLKLKQLIQV